MRFILCKLKPKGALHLGTKEAIQEASDEYIHSDTLFSALCNCLRLLYGKDELEEMLNLFNRDKEPFLISSAFPYLHNDLLFPLPKHLDMAKLIDDPKPFKKVRFVSCEIFEEIVRGENINEYLIAENLVQDKKVLLTGKLEDKIWESQEVPRVTLDRRTSTSSIYHFTEIRYSKHCGLFFLLDLKNPDYEKKLKASINVLAHEGIGGDRTSGKGLFEKPEFSEWSIQTGNASDFITLSLYYPKREEIESIKQGWYELIKRSGWIYSLDAQTYRRKSVRMLEEGSVFPDLGNKGELVDVTPDIMKDYHSVCRYGYAFKIPIEVRRYEIQI